MTDTELLAKIYWLTYSMHADTPMDHMQIIQAIRKLVLDHEDIVENKFARHHKV